MTDWFEPIRAYCERTGPDFWAEPLNAVSNAAFLLAAIAATRRALRVPADRAGLALAGLTAIVGFGSFLFHTLAVHWSMLADVIPIALFIHGYLWLALHRLLGLGALTATGAVVAFLTFSSGLTPALDALTGRAFVEISNGSIAYLPALLALMGVAAALLRPQRRAEAAARREAGLRLADVAGLFLASLAARTLDGAACPIMPFGTHWLWHLLNAGVLYGLIATAILFRRRTMAPG